MKSLFIVLLTAFSLSAQSETISLKSLNKAKASLTLQIHEAIYLESKAPSTKKELLAHEVAYLLMNLDEIEDAILHEEQVLKEIR